MRKCAGERRTKDRITYRFASWNDGRVSQLIEFSVLNLNVGAIIASACRDVETVKTSIHTRRPAL